VIIGEGCVVGAASVVTKSLPPYTICLGIPCRPVKTRFNSEELTRHLSLVNSQYNVNTVIGLWKQNGIE
jgi:serine acetyltransferase